MIYCISIIASLTRIRKLQEENQYVLFSITIDNLYALSELFQVSMDEMLCGNRKKYVYQPKTPQEKRLYAYYVELKQRVA